MNFSHDDLVGRNVTLDFPNQVDKHGRVVGASARGVLVVLRSNSDRPRATFYSWESGVALSFDIDAALDSKVAKVQDK